MCQRKRFQGNQFKNKSKHKQGRSFSIQETIGYQSISRNHGSVIRSRSSHNPLELECYSHCSKDIRRQPMEAISFSATVPVACTPVRPLISYQTSFSLKINRFISLHFPSSLRKLHVLMQSYYQIFRIDESQCNLK